MSDRTSLTWALCLATKDRHDVLETCIRLAMAQTVPPIEIVIADASDDWSAGAARMAAILGDRPEIRLDYGPALRPSTAVQRNQAVRRATADIAFLIDDDTFMYPDCAEEILRVYAANDDVVAVAGRNAGVSPVSARPSLARRESFGTRYAPWIGALTRRNPVVRFIAGEVLLMKVDRLFLRYRDARPRRAGAARAVRDTVPARFILGYCLTARRAIALAEPFDDGLLGPAILEDADATYRYSRHGLNVTSLKGRLFHFESGANRVQMRRKRQLEMANMAYLVHKNAAPTASAPLGYGILLARRIVADLIRDALSRRWSLPTMRGAAAAVPIAVRVFSRAPRDLQPWYEDVQRRILGWSDR